MLFKKIHHVAIICADYEASKRFYIDLLGFQVISEIYREARHSWRCDLISGDCHLELFTFPTAPPRPSTPEAQGLRHLAFEVDDVAASKLELEAKGIFVEPIRVDELTGKSFTFFQDPDGLPLELYGS